MPSTTHAPPRLPLRPAAGSIGVQLGLPRNIAFPNLAVKLRYDLRSAGRRLSAASLISSDPSPMKTPIVTVVTTNAKAIVLNISSCQTINASEHRCRSGRLNPARQQTCSEQFEAHRRCAFRSTLSL
eukprot:TRINITY_DN7209_c0_g1_i1.p1 TRINITY_DN7209_c0_g1~~TRINITY_DN7209_c0_g1_i1.p1  ORF type:complete len:127 (-),score=4.79 TRINITY_DN7209_c0_g1_i1:10-390(-)